MYLFCGELPKIFLMIRLQTKVQYPSLHFPSLTCVLGKDSLSEVLLGGICLAHPHVTLVRLPMIFLAFLLWRYRVVCTVHLGKVFLARSTISSNKLPAYLQLYFQSYESLNVAVISQMATPLSMHIDFCQHEGIKDRLSCTLLSNATFCEAQPDRE